MNFRLQVMRLLAILLIATFCFGCGKNKHEVEISMEDEYGYAGTWYGQVNHNAIMVLNIIPKEKRAENSHSKSALTYDMLNFLYVLHSKGALNDQEIVLTWDMALDERQADAQKNDGTLLVFGGGIGGPGLGISNTQGWGHMRLDGKKLVLVSDKNETIKFLCEDDYDDLIDEFNELKSKVEKDTIKTLRSSYPNAKINVVNVVTNAPPPQTVLVK